MFQVYEYFMKNLGRPANSTGRKQVLKHYNRRLELPIPEQEEDLQHACRDILAVEFWAGFFRHFGIPLPSRDTLVQVL